MLPWQLHAAPEPINTEFRDDRILAELPTSTPAAPEPTNPERAADTLKALITQARSTGEPRYLGYAQTLIGRWPEAQLTDRLLVLRATPRQSLHQFEPARADLARVLSGAARNRQRIQARLTLANLELVQGRYRQARQHCLALQSAYPGLIAASCQALVSARTGNARQAYRTLKRQVNEAATAGTTDPTSRLWAEADALNRRLRERFAEAKWRGAMLHKRDFARFQLDVEQQPEVALKFAMANWQSQREPPDTRLALRAAQATDNQEQLKRVMDWLSSHGQADARYPEVR